jgi:hypothetical protein
MTGASVTRTDDPWLAEHVREYRLILEQIALDDRPRFDGLLESTLQTLEWAVALASGDTVPADTD